MKRVVAETYRDIDFSRALINDALLEHIHRQSALDAVRQVVREELAPYGTARGSNLRLQRTRSARR
jgi:hypothetical protein